MRFNIQTQLDELVRGYGYEGYNVRIALPVPPNLPMIQPGEVATAIRNACIELNKIGNVVRNYADLIVELAPDTLNVKTVKTCLPKLLELFNEVQSSLERNQAEAHADEKKFYEAALGAVKTAKSVLTSAEIVEQEVVFAPTKHIEVFFGATEDGEHLVQAFRAGGVPKAFDWIIKTGKSRGYELVVDSGDLLFHHKDFGLLLIQYADDELVKERVEELKESARQLDEEEAPQDKNPEVATA